MHTKSQLTILDVDTGVDDALAIAYAVHSPELKMLGLTTCFGNVTVDEAARNSLILLERLGRSDIPVFKGADVPLQRQKRTHPRHIHGEHGLGEAAFEQPLGKPNDQHAVDYIIEQLERYPQQVTLVMVGPLTNLALALEKAPQLAQLVHKVVIMGGAVRTHGNVTSSAEANIHSDPEAADKVFRAGLPLTVVGLDVTMKTLLPLSEVERWRERLPDIGGFFGDMTAFYIQFYESVYPGIGGCALHDPLAIGVAIDPTLVRELPLNVIVETEGDEVGRTRELSEGDPTCHVCVEVDAERFVDHFLSRVL